jgi:hypothetical protein
VRRNVVRFTNVLFLVALWGILRMTGVALPISGVFAVVLMVLSLIVLTLEFYKSGDIGTRSFRIELALALLAVIVTTALITHLWWANESRYLIDVVIFFVVLTDAFLGTYNSYRTALRNVQAGFAHGMAGDASD